jgi:hypothetical protein
MKVSPFAELLRLPDGSHLRKCRIGDLATRVLVRMMTIRLSSLAAKRPANST